MKMLDGKVALVTGAGRGIGRAEALLLAKYGAIVFVNDLGVEHDGTGSGKVADSVVEEIKKRGGKAFANYDSVVDFEKTKKMVEQAISECGTLDIVVNNAGILRDKMIFNMTEQDWDLMAVHTKGTFNLTHHFGKWLREEIKAGKRTRKGKIINTSSTAGLFGTPGQSNYGAAKSGIATFSMIVSRELRKYCTVNVGVPIAGTRMTIDSMPKGDPTRELMKSKNKSGLDIFNPKNYASLVVYLASDEADDITGQVFGQTGDMCWIYRGWRTVNSIHNNGKSFTPEILAERIKTELMKDIETEPERPDKLGELFNR